MRAARVPLAQRAGCTAVGCAVRVRCTVWRRRRWPLDPSVGPFPPPAIVAHRRRRAGLHSACMDWPIRQCVPLDAQAVSLVRIPCAVPHRQAGCCARLNCFGPSGECGADRLLQLHATPPRVLNGIPSACRLQRHTGRCVQRAVSWRQSAAEMAERANRRTVRWTRRAGHISLGCTPEARRS